ncbi:hypothetical protein A33M_4260 [Rhodovulum sp. PH10]|nr:hypothetical protein A33M_4260 [Rhodovulum sp. PH10]
MHTQAGRSVCHVILACGAGAVTQRSALLRPAGRRAAMPYCGGSMRRPPPFPCRTPFGQSKSRAPLDETKLRSARPIE